MAGGAAFPKIRRGWRRLTGKGAPELVPQARLSGPMPWVIAIMVALTVIAAAGALTLRNAVNSARAELAGGVTVQIVEADRQERTRQAKLALARLKQHPAVTSARLVPQGELDVLMEPWLGDEAAGMSAIPMPALIDARLNGPATPARLNSLRAKLLGVAPAARVDAQSDWLGAVFGAITSLQWLATALILLLAFATASAVLLAARTALGAHRETIEIVHLLGATDQQIARLFQRSIGVDAALGGAAGFSLAVIVILFLGQQFAGLEAGIASGSSLTLGDWFILALAPLVGTILAMLTARFSILRSLGNML